MQAEALPWCDDVVVDDAQGREAHVVGAVMIREGEGVPGLEPAVVGVEAVVRFAKLE